MTAPESHLLAGATHIARQHASTSTRAAAGGRRPLLVLAGSTSEAALRMAGTSGAPAAAICSQRGGQERASEQIGKLPGSQTAPGAVRLPCRYALSNRCACKDRQGLGPWAGARGCASGPSSAGWTSTAAPLSLCKSSACRSHAQRAGSGAGVGAPLLRQQQGSLWSGRSNRKRGNLWAVTRELWRA